MARHSTIDSLYRAQVARFARGAYTAEQGFKEIAEAGKADLYELTSGNIDKKTLAKLGHPFGRGASPAQRSPTGLVRGAGRKSLKALIGRGKLPYLPINVQSGRLRRGIYIRWHKRGKSTFADVGSKAKHSRYIFWPAGTSKMVGRKLMTGRKVGFGGPAMALEKRWAQRKKAWRERFITNMRKP